MCLSNVLTSVNSSNNNDNDNDNDNDKIPNVYPTIPSKCSFQMCLPNVSPNVPNQNDHNSPPHKGPPERPSDKETWKLLYANVHGVKEKRSSLEEILHSENPHIFLLTETLLQTTLAIPSLAEREITEKEAVLVYS